VRLVKCVMVIAVLITFLGSMTPLFSISEDMAVKKAIRYKLQGRLEKALELYEKTIVENPKALSIPDEGLMSELIEKYKRLSKNGDDEVKFKLADYYDMGGYTDDAIKTFSSLLSSKNKKIAREAKERMKALQKEKELYEKMIRESSKEEKSEDIPQNSVEDVGQPTIDPMQEVEVLEQQAREREKEQEISELKDKISKMEKEVEEAEKIMEKNKRDRDGRGHVRTWRLKPEDANKDKYNNTFARRYRQSKRVYERKLQELNRLKEKLNSYK